MGVLGGPLDLSEGSVLVYENVSGDETSRFIIRLARFHPDIVMEWESVSHQGTIHLFSAAVREARKITISGLFEPGIDHETGEATTKWFPEELYRRLLDHQTVKIELNNIAAKFKLKRKDVVKVLLNKKEIELPVALIEDSRKGIWTVLEDPENPLVVLYESPYYEERLVSVATGQKNNLRWIRRLPPVK